VDHPILDLVPDPNADPCHTGDQNEQAGEHEALRQGGLGNGKPKG
jgi:hypothetical protein